MGRAMVAGGCPGMKVPTTGIQADTLAVGSVVKLMENGTAVEYIVVNQGKPSGSSLYDDSCDGVWLMRKDLHSNVKWNVTESNTYGSSSISAWLNGTFFNSLGSLEQATIKQVTIPWRRGNAYAMTLECKVFLLSNPEVHLITDFGDDLDGAALDYFSPCAFSGSDSKRIAYLNGSATSWWLRTPAVSGTDYAQLVKNDGSYTCLNVTNHYGARPALILPKTALFDRTTLQLKGAA